MASILILIAGLLAVPLAVEAQSPARIPRIGYLILSPLADPPSAERKAFLDGLRELGYVVGQNTTVEYCSANWNRELLPDLAEELVDLKVDVIVVVPDAVHAARQATRTIPIVLAGFPDPVEAGLVTSLARPGGNITGTAFAPWEIVGKQLALLKEALPKLSRVNMLWDPAIEGTSRQWQQIKAAARMLGVTIERMDTKNPKDFPGAFSTMTRKRPDALIIALSPLTSAYRPIIVEFATKHRLPTMFGHRGDVEAGGLMAYSPSSADLFRRTAGYVDRILKGARPGDLPVERPTKFELIVNLKTARALGLTLPLSVLIQADTVIDQ